MAMQGEELKAMRRAAGLSQAEMAAAIGMSRESVGLMERGQALIETRTELAVRFVAGQRPATLRTVPVVQRDVAEVLASALQREGVTGQDVDDIRAAQADWLAGGGGQPGSLVLQQLTITSMALLTPSTDPVVRSLFARDFRQLVKMWDTLAEPAPMGLWDRIAVGQTPPK